MKVRTIAKVVGRRLAIAICLIPVIILRMLSIRVLDVMEITAIGHLAIEVDCYLKEQALGGHPKYRALLFAPTNMVANGRLAEYWRSYLWVIGSPWAWQVFRRLSRLPVIRRIVTIDTHEYVYEVKATATANRIQKEWGDRPPLLSLNVEDIARGEQLLEEFGIPPGGWFVCVHARESGIQGPWYNFRNCDIETYSLAIEAIVERGGWCIRMGDPSMKKLHSMRNVVDYAHHPRKADWMDLFLAARCRFWLGSCSGAFLMASIFGVPVAATNMVPLSAVLPFGKRDLGIPKMLWSKKERRVLAFPEILEAPISVQIRRDRVPLGQEYWEAGWEVIDNTPEDILGLALEQLERTSEQVLYTAGDEELQTRFKALLRPGHYSYGSEARVGRDFLRKHAALLLSDAT